MEASSTLGNCFLRSRFMTLMMKRIPGNRGKEPIKEQRLKLNVTSTIGELGQRGNDGSKELFSDGTEVLETANKDLHHAVVLEGLRTGDVVGQGRLLTGLGLLLLDHVAVDRERVNIEVELGLVQDVLDEGLEEVAQESLLLGTAVVVHDELDEDRVALEDVLGVGDLRKEKEREISRASKKRVNTCFISSSRAYSKSLSRRYSSRAFWA